MVRKSPSCGKHARDFLHHSPCLGCNDASNQSLMKWVESDNPNERDIVIASTESYRRGHFFENLQGCVLITFVAMVGTIKELGRKLRTMMSNLNPIFQSGDPNYKPLPRYHWYVTSFNTDNIGQQYHGTKVAWHWHSMWLYTDSCEHSDSQNMMRICATLDLSKCALSSRHTLPK